MFQVDKMKSLEDFVDASFVGDWNKSWSEEPSSVLSRTGFVTYFADCPII